MGSGGWRRSARAPSDEGLAPAATLCEDVACRTSLARAIDRLTEPEALARMSGCACASHLLLSALVAGPSVITRSDDDVWPGLAGLVWELDSSVFAANVAAGLLAAVGGWIVGALARSRGEAAIIFTAVAVPLAWSAGWVAVVDRDRAVFIFGWGVPWAIALAVRARKEP